LQGFFPKEFREFLHWRRLIKKELVTNLWIDDVLVEEINDIKNGFFWGENGLDEQLVWESNSYVGLHIERPTY